MNTEHATNLRRTLLRPMPASERRLELAGISTVVLEGGHGPPFVLLHGPSGNASHWMRVFPGLAEENRVIAPDLPGHGASDAGDELLDVARVLSWVAALVEQTCPSPPVLVGHLLGGAIAMRFALEHPESVRRLELIDTLGLRAFEPAPPFAAALNAFLAQPTKQTHRDLWRHCAHDLERLRGAMGEVWSAFEDYNVDRARSPSVQAAVEALMEQFGGPPIPPEQLARIAVPTRLIWGRHDLATPLHVAEAASRRYGWPLHVIEGSNDDPPVERPDELVATLRRKP